MPIQRRLNPRVKLPIHRNGGSVLDPPLYFQPGSTFYENNPHLDMWPCGARVTAPHGKKVLLIGHVIRTVQGFRAWITSKRVYVDHYTGDGWTARRPFFPFVDQTIPFKATKVRWLYDQYNIHRDVRHVGVFPTRADAEAAMVEEYEEFFETVVSPWA